MIYKVGDKVKIIKEVHDDARILGSIGTVEATNGQGERLSVRLRPTNEHSRINSMGWWVAANLVEIVEYCREDCGSLPAGVSRCKNCRDAITSSESGYCCDCKPPPVVRGKGTVVWA